MIVPYLLIAVFVVWSARSIRSIRRAALRREAELLGRRRGLHGGLCALRVVSRNENRRLELNVEKRFRS